MGEDLNLTKRKARIAGVWYLALALIAPVGLIIVPGKILVSGDIAATSANILEYEFLYRTGIASNVLSNVLFVVLAFLIFQLFKEVNRNWAGILVGLVLVAVSVAFIGDVLKFTSLMILKGGIVESQELAYSSVAVLLKLSGYSFQIVQLYWGLWLIPFGMLAYRSGFIPRILGILLLLNGAAYIIISFTFLLFPDYLSLIGKILMPFFYLGEIPMVLWLVIIGAKKKQEIVHGPSLA